ncbi:hypothetical protein BD289DRAFT_482356 [Coniella lustricola]|uniref:Uncharacterized protein n=1 Tax=Coniella lustricola TaxID=2025994 RepID=A0A2T3A925_9PEZI|nr:hypothetical protein BD289DRAFT_482356 [Coniella lustricola]
MAGIYTDKLLAFFCLRPRYENPSVALRNKGTAAAAAISIIVIISPPPHVAWKQRQQPPDQRMQMDADMTVLPLCRFEIAEARKNKQEGS